MSNSRKKVVVRYFDGFLAWGYLPPAGFVRGESVELLDIASRVILLDLNKIKTIAYVKDFNLDDRTDPERLGRRAFQTRPRAEGLWIRLEFHDRDTLEGVSFFDLGFLEAAGEDSGIAVSPPDGKSNTQRVFVPRSALTSVQVLGWIGAPSKPKAAKVERVDQGSLFDGK